jgi:hypothetical protein
MVIAGSSPPATLQNEGTPKISRPAAKNSNYDGLQLPNVKDREHPLPPGTVIGFHDEAGAAKDRSPVANIDPDRSIVGLERMPITPVPANYHAGNVARWEIGSHAVE